MATQVPGWKIAVITGTDKPTTVTNVNAFLTNLWINTPQSGLGIIPGGQPVIHAITVDASAYMVQVDYPTFVTIA